MTFLERHPGKGALIMSSGRFVSSKPTFSIVGHAADVVDILAKMSLSLEKARDALKVVNEVEDHYRLPLALHKVRQQALHTLNAA